ncbi:MAG: hypothetical protein KBT11_08940 [Treponema sp.]|nr:hypothetical protein [Candidatus Treponema equifaecale]
MDTSEIIYRRQFDKINLLNFMCSDLISYAEKKYGSEFPEYVDMTCGAVPEGEYEKIIDPSSPREFLDLYTDICLKRFKTVTSKILELGDGYDIVLKNYFFNEGKKLGLPKPSSLDEAYELIQVCILEKLTTCGSHQIETKGNDEIIWKNPNSDLNFWMFMKDLICGIIEGSNITFSIDDSVFRLKKE